jgi:hypothetical protein
VPRNASGVSRGSAKCIDGNTGKFKYVFYDPKIRVKLRVSKKLRVKLRVMIIIKKLRVKLRDKLRVIDT